MNNDITSTGIISQEQFDQYAAQWLSVASDPKNPDLAKSFVTAAGERLLLVSFSIQRIVELVSAVGVGQIKARFLLVPGADGQPHFSLVLFAAEAGAEGQPLSAYYLADAYWNATPTPPVLGEMVPQNLAAVWLANWKGAPAVTSALFATNYGPLQGYNFDIKDFINPLFTDQPYEKQQVHISFGLHSYFAAGTKADAPTQTFGLVVRLYNPAQATQGTTDDPYYDLSAPCPPNH